MPTPGKQQAQAFQTKIPRTLNKNYLLYLPKDYDTDSQKRWPFILFLHGAGERGNNLKRVKAQGLAKILQKPQDFP